MPYPAGTFLVVRLYYGTPERDPEQAVLYYAGDSTPADPSTTAQDAADDLDSAIAPLLKAVLTTSTGYHGTAVALHNGGVVYNANSVVSSGNGNVVSDESPDFVAAVIQKRTGFAGRAGMGRWFIGGVPETNTDESHLNAGALADYQNLGIQFKTTFLAGGVNWSAQLFSQSNSAFYPIITVRAVRTLATQRRRLVRSVL